MAEVGGFAVLWGLWGGWLLVAPWLSCFAWIEFGRFVILGIGLLVTARIFFELVVAGFAVFGGGSGYGSGQNISLQVCQVGSDRPVVALPIAAWAEL